MKKKSFSLESRAHLVLKRFILIGYWIRLNNKQPVCFQARGNSPGIVNANVDGFIVAIKLVYLYGHVTCDKRNKYYQSFWGCSNHPNKNYNDLNIYLRDIYSNQIITNHKDDTFGWYSRDCFTAVSKHTLFESIHNPLYVHQGFEMRIWYGDDKKDRNEELSEGET